MTFEPTQSPAAGGPLPVAVIRRARATATSVAAGGVVAVLGILVLTFSFLDWGTMTYSTPLAPAGVGFSVVTPGVGRVRAADSGPEHVSARVVDRGVPPDNADAEADDRPTNPGLSTTVVGAVAIVSGALVLTRRYARLGSVLAVGCGIVGVAVGLVAFTVTSFVWGDVAKLRGMDGIRVDFSPGYGLYVTFVAAAALVVAGLGAFLADGRLRTIPSADN